MKEIPASHRDLVEAPGVAILSTIGADGYPQTTALIYLLDDDGKLKVSLNTTRQKTKNLKRRPECSIFFLDPKNPFRTLEIRAKADLAPDEGKQFAVKVGSKYGIDVRDNDRPGEDRVVVTLDPVKVNTYGG